MGKCTVVAVAIEGRNDESLAMAREAAASGKHLWYDKPAGDDWAGYLAFADEVKNQTTAVGYNVVTVGGSTTLTYKLDQTSASSEGTGGVNGCNADGARADTATVLTK